MTSSKKWTAVDIPNQSGKVAVVTGSNTGLGLETARELARSGAKVVLAIRTLSKGEIAADDIRASAPGADVSLQQLDLGSLNSVRTAATELSKTYDSIDLLINNAGVMYTQQGATVDGFETQIGTNHLGHFALTGLLLERLMAAEGSRVVNVSSLAHRIRSAIDLDDLHATKGYNRVAAYGRSKLANLLFTYELQRRLQAVGAKTSALVAHPGMSATELGRHLPLPDAVLKLSLKTAQSAAMGALPTLRAATDLSAAGGQYYGPGGFMEGRGHPVVVKSSKRSHDRELQAGLWAVSEQQTGVSFGI